MAWPGDGAIPLYEELGIGFVRWTPLGVGILNEGIDARTHFAEGDIRGIPDRFASDTLPNNLELVELMKVWAKRKQARLG